jgi:thymidylate synthase (FAD)
MPHVQTLQPKHHAFKVLFGQKPLTCFKDYRNSIKVDLIKYDNRDTMLQGTYDFVKATWSEDGRESERATKEEMDEALSAMLSGKALGLGLETVSFIFRISGITRLDTHQIVRQRIGVTFSQQCTGDRMLHHNDVLVEESIANQPVHLKNFVDATLQTKNTYAGMIDSQAISIQAARSLLPHNLETFIFMKIDLSTLLFFHSKRIDDGSQTWQMNVISQQMADAVCEVYPELKDVFERNKKRFKFQKEASADRKNIFSTGLYVPLDDEFDYHDRDFLYPIKKNDMHFTNTPVEPLYFWGTKQIDSVKYKEIKDLYEQLDKEVKSNYMTNEEICTKAQIINTSIENTL